MEITEPVILSIPQGKRRVRIEIESRADGRDLIAAIANAMLRLPGDGVPASRHERHGGGEMDADAFRARIKPMTEGDLHVAFIYAHGRCPEAVEAALSNEEETRPGSEPEPVSSVPQDGDEDGPMDDEAELRRAGQIREDDRDPVRVPVYRLACGCDDSDGERYEPGDSWYCAVHCRTSVVREAAVLSVVREAAVLDTALPPLAAPLAVVK